MVIADTSDVEVVGEAATGAEAVRLAGEVRPDVVLMDIRMPGMAGIEASRLIAEFAGRPPPAVEACVPNGITDREREGLTLVGLGRSNTEIATALHITIGTVKTHVGRLPVKLDARDRVQLVIIAYEVGLVVPPSR
ncbi:response regulator transcription factor [Actinoplanes sp. NPDC049599]|uniref:response regulator transcription factor n=1 Tax=Actinoplanes sp. NPDC049599 TaxID=3363903 RepID=UPI0037B13142